MFEAIPVKPRPAVALPAVGDLAILVGRPRLSDDLRDEGIRILKLPIDDDARAQPNPRQVEELLDHPLHALAARDDSFDTPARFGQHLIPQQEDTRRIQRGVQGITEIVAEHSDEQLAKLDARLGFLSRFLLASKRLPNLFLRLRPPPQRTTKLLFEVPAASDLSFEGPRPGEALGRDYVGVDAAHVEEPRRFALLVEIADRVRAEERKCVLLARVVPQLFKADRRVGIAVPPEKVDHFAVGAKACVGAALPHRRYQPGEKASKGFTVRHSVDHELRERVSRVEQGELARSGGLLAADRFELPEEAFSMSLGRDDDEPVCRPETGSEKVAHHAEEGFVLFIELNEVTRMNGIGDELMPDVAMNPGMGRGVRRRLQREPDDIRGRHHGPSLSHRGRFASAITV
ncbi:MAG TPA: hypothetical protein VKU41_20160 [Polyangiaceae bacterium]|nr:hypothetical protein [Polyangiaceae bacterium]